jgi:hypothetical protein
MGMSQLRITVHTWRHSLWGLESALECHCGSFLPVSRRPLLQPSNLFPQECKSKKSPFIKLAPSHKSQRIRAGKNWESKWDVFKRSVDGLFTHLVLVCAENAKRDQVETCWADGEVVSQTSQDLMTCLRKRVFWERESTGGRCNSG